MTAPVPNPYFLYPFAGSSSGGVDTTPIDNTGADSGTVNYQNGWTPNYAYVSTNPASLPIPRPQMNQLFLDITYALQQLQTQGYPLWVAPASGSPPVGGPTDYPIYATMAYDAGSGIQIWESQVGSNTSVPGADDNWLLISGVQLPTGTSIDYCGVTPPPGFLAEDGSTVLRATYPRLLAAIAPIQTCTTHTSTTLTVADSSTMYAGMHIEGAGIGIQAGTTISSITDSTTVVLSITATASSTGDVQFFNWGAGNGTTTFTLPNSSRRVTMGSSGPTSAIIGNVVGQSGGAETHLITLQEMAPHTHNYQLYTLGGSTPNSTGRDSVTDPTPTSEVPAGGTQTAMTIVQPANIKLKCIKT